MRWAHAQPKASRPGLKVSTHQKDWYFIPEQAEPAPHLAPPEGCAVLRIVLVPVNTPLTKDLNPVQWPGPHPEPETLNPGERPAPDLSFNHVSTLMDEFGF